MSDQEILTKAIEQAIAGGWEAQPLGGTDMWPEFSGLERQHVIKLLLDGDGDLAEPYRIIIFNHDFAKALWGEAPDHIGYGYKYNIKHNPYFDEAEFSIDMKAPTWQLKLVQMVIAEDPIKYLGENI